MNFAKGRYLIALVICTSAFFALPLGWAEEQSKPFLSRFRIMGRTGYFASRVSPDEPGVWKENAWIPTHHSVQPVFFFAGNFGIRVGAGAQVRYVHVSKTHFTNKITIQEVYAGPWFVATWDISNLPFGLYFGTGFYRPIFQRNRLVTDRMSVDIQGGLFNTDVSVELGPRYMVSPRLAVAAILEIGAVNVVWSLGATVTGGMELALW